VGVECLHGLMAMSIKVITIQMWGMGMDKCIGMMAVIIKENGEMGNWVVKVKFMFLVKA
jgi:hypothetical protein